MEPASDDGGSAWLSVCCLLPADLAPEVHAAVKLRKQETPGGMLGLAHFACYRLPHMCEDYLISHNPLHPCKC